ncbi:UvrD-helicase domain-containing protein [Ectopseudomonas guguanensis]|nr:UvrD-helicase domain-containing protein [Pseudomonas guguanensis]
MEYVWAPSALGRMLTRSPKWQLRLVDGHFELRVGSRSAGSSKDERFSVQVENGFVWASLRYPGGKLGGLPKAAVEGLSQSIAVVEVEQQEQRRLERERRERERVATFKTVFELIHGWVLRIAKELAQSKAQRRWFTHEQQAALLSAKPLLPILDEEVDTLLRDVHLQKALGVSGVSVEQVLKGWGMDWSAAWKSFNERHTRDELIACEPLLSKVEKRPLNEEQARAVICFDNRVQVVASAGSGKTSTMVAKAAYAIDRGFVEPNEVVMLAFNKDAAEELAERARQSFERLEMNVTVRAKTFHRLGLAIIGYATKKKPRVPSWAVKQKDSLQRLANIVDGLKDSSVAFRTRWDLFRLVFGRDIPAFRTMSKPAKPKADADTIRTLRGEPVKSLEECMIANWLFYNGVNYEYERNYEHDTATAEHSQYQPDFYYPDIGLYHEHFALDEHGQPPAHFEGYLKGTVWKRKLHQEHRTQLIETTSHQLRQNTWIEHLTYELTRRGIVLDPNPDRPIPSNGQTPMNDQQLLSLLRVFIGHAKSNCLTPEALVERVEQMAQDAFKHRYRMFLDILWPVMRGWNDALAGEGGIDFEDMLNMAADYVEQGRCSPRYRLVMADEFQDASQARARLCKALVQQPGRFFFAVGDDWQSINRFAGADVSVMTEFVERFGSGQVLKLEETFRCPQAICDISSRFVVKNPAQIPKRVHSKTPAIGPALRAIAVKKRDDLQGAVSRYLEELVEGVVNGSIPGEKGRKLKVYVLGRYNKDARFIPDDWRHRYGEHIELSFLSIHRSKGAEADYVILPAMISAARSYSFPSIMADDPIMNLAMADGDSYPFGEERRLFYVALTRARRSIAMFTIQGQISVFLMELVKDGAVTVEVPDDTRLIRKKCPRCHVGEVVSKKGPWGSFQSCNNYPSCDYKPSKRSAEVSRKGR